MADDLTQQVYASAMTEYDSALVTASHKYQLAQVRGDVTDMRDAALEIASLRAQRTEFNQMAREGVAQAAAAPKPNPHGLDADEQDAARAFGFTDEEYADGKRKQAEAKLRGEHKGQQGNQR